MAQGAGHRSAHASRLCRTTAPTGGRGLPASRADRAGGGEPEHPWAGCATEAFAPEEAHRLAARFQWHYTPEHGSWLNIAECELSVLARQCLDRRIPDKDRLVREVAAWEKRRNQAAVRVVGPFTTADARITLRRLYPVITS